MAWIRLPGKASRYRQTDTGEEISRRQFDRHYGRLAAQGFRSNEAQAKANRKKDIEQYLSRPARGRGSLLRKPEAERAASLLERKLSIARRKEKRNVPLTIENRTLGKKAQGIRFDIPYDLSIVKEWLDAASRNPDIIGAGVGVNFFVLETAELKPLTAYGAFLMSDWRKDSGKVMNLVEAGIDKLSDTRGDNMIISELTVTIGSLFVWFSWSIEWLKRNRNWKR